MYVPVSGLRVTNYPLSAKGSGIVISIRTHHIGHPIVPLKLQH
jgi:hypothetical protein